MKRFAREMGGRLHGLVGVLLTLLMLAAAAAAVLGWRLAQGPLDIAWVARRIEAAANLPGKPTRLSIGQATLEWSPVGSENDAATDGRSVNGGSAGRGLSLMLRDLHLVDLRDMQIARVDMMD